MPAGQRCQLQQHESSRARGDLWEEGKAAEPSVMGLVEGPGLLVYPLPAFQHTSLLPPSPTPVKGAALGLPQAPCLSVGPALHCCDCLQEAQTYADDNSLLFMETSAKTAMNVNEIFMAIGKWGSCANWHCAECHLPTQLNGSNPLTLHPGGARPSHCPGSLLPGWTWPPLLVKGPLPSLPPPSRITLAAITAAGQPERI